MSAYYAYLAAKRGGKKRKRPSRNEEASGIATICEWLREDQNVLPDDILFLLRSDHNGQFSKPLRLALEKKGFRVATITDPLEPLNAPTKDDGKTQADGRLLLSLLRLCVNQNDHLAWRTLLLLRSNGLGEKAHFALYDLARNRGKGFAEAVFAVRDNPSLLGKFGRKVTEEIRAVEEIIAAAPKQDGIEPLEFVNLLAQTNISDETIREEVLGVFERSTLTASPDDLEELLRIINVSPAQENQLETDAVNIMSMHQAKGLTADATFVVAAEDEYIPGRALGGAIDDERRLLYVSLTRAKHFLFITHCRRRTGPQRHSGSTSGKEDRNLTRFLRGGPVESRDGREYVRGLSERETG